MLSSSARGRHGPAFPRARARRVACRARGRARAGTCRGAASSEMRTSTATAPAAARRTNSPAIAITSTSSTVLSRMRVGRLEREEPREARERQGAEHRREREREHGEPRGERQRAAGPELAACHGPCALDRVQPIGRDVAHVVHEVGGARCGAVRDEGRHRRAPAAGVAELGGEDDPREQEEVLRPLPRPQRDDRRRKRRPPRGKLDDRRGQRFRHAGKSKRRARGARAGTGFPDRART